MPDQRIQTKDFDPEKLASEAAAHGKDISLLSDRVTGIETKLNNPEQLALTLEAATKDSKRLDTLFSGLFCNMMKNDEAVKAAIKDKMDVLDRNSAYAILRKLGGLIGFAAWTIIVVVITAWAEHHFGK